MKTNYLSRILGSIIVTGSLLFGVNSQAKETLEEQVKELAETAKKCGVLIGKMENKEHKHYSYRLRYQDLVFDYIDEPETDKVESSDAFSFKNGGFVGNARYIIRANQMTKEEIRNFAEVLSGLRARYNSCIPNNS